MFLCTGQANRSIEKEPATLFIRRVAGFMLFVDELYGI